MRIRKIAIGFFMLMATHTGVMAQHMLQFIIKDQPVPGLTEKIFVAGNFNQWNASATSLSYDSSYKIWYANLPGIDAGKLEFKFTKGNWASVETDSSGEDISNRIVQLHSDSLLILTVAAWKDPRLSKKHTASPRVQIADSVFPISTLHREAAIRVYLPKSYASSKKRYPVLYMHDGQNIFDEYTSSYGEWGVDEILDSLQALGRREAIVVGIDNGPNRLREYNPYDHEKYGKAQGDAYVDFLVNELKPFIDKRYRTLKDKRNTIIAGSSMGGLISYYAMLKESNVFGKAGVFSPSFWIAPEINHFTDSVASKISGKVFFAAGALEGESMLSDMQDIMDILGKKSRASIYSFVDKHGEHNEATWHRWFPHFYLWALADGHNYIMDIDK